MSFRYYARKVRNQRLSLGVRRSALNSCLLRLAWLEKRQFTETAARFAARVEDDADSRREESMLARLTEIEAERNRFLEALRAFERQRIQEKRRGRRRPRPVDVAALYATAGSGRSDVASLEEGCA